MYARLDSMNNEKARPLSAGGAVAKNHRYDEGDADEAAATSTRFLNALGGTSFAQVNHASSAPRSIMPPRHLTRAAASNTCAGIKPHRRYSVISANAACGAEYYAGAPRLHQAASSRRRVALNRQLSMAATEAADRW